MQVCWLDKQLLIYQLLWLSKQENAKFFNLVLKGLIYLLYSMSSPGVAESVGTSDRWCWLINFIYSSGRGEKSDTLNLESWGGTQRHFMEETSPGFVENSS